MAQKVKVTQVKSPIGRRFDQRQTLIGLGLNKLHRSRVVTDTPSMRGQIDKVKHLLKVEPVEGGEGMKLNELRDNPGARTARKRLGRGIGSGLGKTSGRGHKGAKARRSNPKRLRGRADADLPAPAEARVQEPDAARTTWSSTPAACRPPSTPGSSLRARPLTPRRSSRPAGPPRARRRAAPRQGRPHGGADDRRSRAPRPGRSRWSRRPAAASSSSAGRRTPEPRPRRPSRKQSPGRSRPGSGAPDGLGRRAARSQHQPRRLQQGDRAQEAPLVHPGRLVVYRLGTYIPVPGITPR